MANPLKLPTPASRKGLIREKERVENEKKNVSMTHMI